MSSLVPELAGLLPTMAQCLPDVALLLLSQPVDRGEEVGGWEATRLQGTREHAQN